MLSFCPNCGKEVSEGNKFCPKCGKQLIETQSEAQEETEAAQLETLRAEMKRDLRGWSFGLVGIGIVSIVFAGFLDPVWGGILIAVGVSCFFIKRRGMYIVFGIVLMLAGIINILGGEVGGWTIFGVFQIGLGIHQIRKFSKYASISRI